MDNKSHAIQAWHDVLLTARRTSTSWQGNPLSVEDHATYTEALVLCAIHMVDLSNCIDGIGDRRVLVQWVYNMTRTDVHKVGTTISELEAAIRGIHDATTVGEFKSRLSPMSQASFNMVVSPIKRLLAAFLEHPSSSLFRPCYQFICFLTHLSLRDLAQDFSDDYRDLERSLPTSYDGDTVKEMNGIMRGWLSDFRVTSDDFVPSHGPGASAELPRTASLHDKYTKLGVDAMMEYVFSKHAGIDCHSFLPFPAVPFKRMCKVIAVPKSIRSLRLISKEPASLQYFQQGVCRSLVHFIHTNDELNAHIDLRNQDRSRRQALQGSASYGKWSTIDLSAASDRVTTALVKEVFRGTHVLPFLVALRSTEALLPDKGKVVLAKYAPMGSALCFPVQTLIFACAVELVYRRRQGSERALRAGSFTVYGDDIIVHNDVYSDVISVLQSLAFVVNESKSYSVPSRFRESCGMHAYDGEDVTPLRLSRRYSSVEQGLTSRHASLYAGLVELANSAKLYRFDLLRLWVLSVILTFPAAPPLFSQSDAGTVFSDMPTNYRADRRWNRNLQRTELRVASPRAQRKEALMHCDEDRSLLFEWLRLASLKERNGVIEPEDLVHVLRGTEAIRLGRDWCRIPGSSYRS